MNDRIVLEIAGFYIIINFKKSTWYFVSRAFQFEIIRFYKEFIIKNIPNKVDYIIDFIDYEDISVYKKNQKRYINFFELLSERHILTNYRISIFQFQTILYYILADLLRNKGFMIHASAISIDDKAYLFVAPSEGGKSTAIRLLYGQESILADDSIILLKKGTDYYVYQTPFKEKQWWVKKSQKPYSLGAIFFIKKANFFFQKKLTSRLIIKSLLNKQLLTAYMPKKLYYSTLNDFVNLIALFYDLYFNKQKTSFRKFIKNILYK